MPFMLNSSSEMILTLSLPDLDVHLNLKSPSATAFMVTSSPPGINSAILTGKPLSETASKEMFLSVAFSG